MNGMLVMLVVPGGAVARDGHIHPGDYLISVNHESLRRVTNSQARAILRRAQLLSTDIRYNLCARCVKLFLSADHPLLARENCRIAAPNRYFSIFEIV